MSPENEKKTFNASLGFVLFALAMAILPWLAYLGETCFPPEYPRIAYLLFPSLSALYFHCFSFFVCCIVSCFPWFAILFLTEQKQSNSFLLQSISLCYWVLVTGIVLFPLIVMGIGISGVATQWGHAFERSMESFVVWITLGFPIALIILSIASFSILTHLKKTWVVFILVGNFLLALACLGARLTIVFILYQL